MICSSNAAQFINQILSDNSGCNHRCSRCGNVAGTSTNSCGCGCVSGCGSNNCGCGCVGGSGSGNCGCGCVGGCGSNNCGCGCDDDDRCSCCDVIANHLLREILQELQAIREILCDLKD